VTALVQHVASGVASGGIYGSLALAIVLIYRATGVINLAQGELATLSAFGCWTLVDHGWAFWPAFGATLALSFGGGVALHALLLQPLRNSPLLRSVLVTAGLALAVNGLDTWIWGGASRSFHGPFSASAVTAGGVALSKQDLGVAGVSLAAALVTGLLLVRTKLGLGLRAVVSPVEARFAGVRVGALAAVGWGLAAALGAVAGMLAAPSLQLDPNMMQRVLLYAFAAAALGGLLSPVGAVVGGIVLGVFLDLAGAYVHRIGGELRPATALAVLAGVLLLRPNGLLGGTAPERA